LQSQQPDRNLHPPDISVTKLVNMLYNPNGNQQNAFTVATANYDTRRYPLCCPHDGTKGLAFRRFADDFLTALATVDLKDANEIYDCAESMLGIDEGGPETPPNAAAPIPMAGGIAAQRRRTRRLKVAYIHLYKHLTDRSLQQMLADEAHNDGYEAWQIVKRECDEPITDLEIQDLKSNVRNLTILGSVGYQNFSISQFRRALNDENGKIPDQADRVSEHDLCLILLQEIAKSSPSLAATADTELKAAPAARAHVHPAGHPNAGERSLSAIVSHFEPLWKSAVSRGSPSVRAPTRTRPGARADGMIAEANIAYEEEAGYDVASDDPQSIGEVLAYVANSMRTARDARDFGKALKEIICWNCKGLGHSKSVCPSTRRERPYSDVISVLSNVGSSSASPSIARKPARRFIGRRPTGTPGKGPRNQARARSVSAYLMDDGTLISHDNTPVEWEDALDDGAPDEQGDEATVQDIEDVALVEYADSLSIADVACVDTEEIEWPCLGAAPPDGSPPPSLPPSPSASPPPSRIAELKASDEEDSDTTDGDEGENEEIYDFNTQRWAPGRENDIDAMFGWPTRRLRSPVYSKTYFTTIDDINDAKHPVPPPVKRMMIPIDPSIGWESNTEVALSVTDWDPWEGVDCDSDGTSMSDSDAEILDEMRHIHELTRALHAKMQRKRAHESPLPA
jgi:hypothetical protein